MKEEIEKQEPETTPEAELFGALDLIPAILSKLDEHHVAEMTRMEEIKDILERLDYSADDLRQRMQSNSGFQCRFPGVKPVTDAMAQTLVSTIKEKVAEVPVKVEHSHIMSMELSKYAEREAKFMIKALAIALGVLTLILFVLAVWYNNSNACWTAKYIRLCTSKELTEGETMVLKSPKFMDDSSLASPWGIYPGEKKQIIKDICYRIEYRRSQKQFQDQ